MADEHGVHDRGVHENGASEIADTDPGAALELHCWSTPRPRAYRTPYFRRTRRRQRSARPASPNRTSRTPSC
ncbi:hypothetical protein ACU686_00720 [Yinghuangia aomiensis]